VLKFRRLDLAEHPGERVMRRHSVFEWKQAPEPPKLRFSELGDGHKIVGAADRSADRKKQNLLNRIKRVARVPGVLDLGETVN